MRESEITRIESMNSIQLLNQLYKEVIGMKVQIAELSEGLKNLKDRSKDFGNETSGIHETCQKRYEKCNEKFENLAIRQIADSKELKGEIKVLIAKYGTICVIAASIITAIITKII